MARSGQGASVTDQGLFPFRRRVPDTIEVKIVAFTGRLARAKAAAVDDGCHSGRTVTPVTRDAV